MVKSSERLIRAHGCASATLVVLNNYIVEVRNLRAIKKRTGDGTVLMLQICAEADANNWFLELRARSEWREYSDEDLKKWYEKFDFYRLGNGYMRRQPGGGSLNENQ